jgi:hypothetical protein
MNNDFKILACFTRSYDKHHDSNNLHLIASTVLVRDEINNVEFIKNIRYSNVSRKFIIVEVVDHFTSGESTKNLHNDLKLEDKDNKKIFENEYLGYVKTSLNELLKLYSSNENKDYIRSLFNYDNTDTKDKDQIYTQCLFIFHNITWSNIVLKFKINNIDISGGGTTTRHILTSSDIILNNYLNLIFNYNTEYIINLGFNTYKNEKVIMSGQIPLDSYRSYLANITEVYKLKGSHTEDVFNKIKLLTNTDESSSFIRIIGNNLLISREIIIKKMILHHETNLIDKIKQKLNTITIERNTYNSKYDRLLETTKNLSNKSKKILKKERSEILNKGFTLDNLSDIIQKYDLEISDLENKLSVNKEQLEKNIDILKKLGFSELFKQYEGIRNKIEYKTANLFRKYNRAQNIRN